MIQRALLEMLLAWKQIPTRKPVLIDGARQTGKTVLLRELFGSTFANTLHIDFLENPGYKAAFEGSLAPHDVLNNLTLITNQRFNPDTDLLILDEIGECERAVSALKYFAEQSPTSYVAASGSNIGLLTGFPVGKVTQYRLNPLTFREFLVASGEAALITAFDAQVNSSVVHNKLMETLTDYFFTGGMPEAVACWYAHHDANRLDRTAMVTKIHADLIEGYRRDFGKYAGKADATLIESVFNSIPSQLSLVTDDSVKRYQFKGVHPRKSRYSDFETAIHWLLCCRLALPNYPIEGEPKSPLAAYRKANRVKLFFFDIGLLNHLLGARYQDIKMQRDAYKGYIAENFVQRELISLGVDPTYSWQSARAEIEFLVISDTGEILPIEVKSGKRTRARSLASYVAKYRPSCTIKLTGTQGSLPEEQAHRVLPLYYAQHLPIRQAL